MLAGQRTAALRAHRSRLAVLARLIGFVPLRPLSRPVGLRTVLAALPLLTLLALLPFLALAAVLVVPVALVALARLVVAALLVHASARLLQALVDAVALAVLDLFQLLA